MVMWDPFIDGKYEVSGTDYEKYLEQEKQAKEQAKNKEIKQARMKVQIEKKHIRALEKEIKRLETETAKRTSKNLAKALFNEEKWITKENVKIAESRIQKAELNSNEKKKYLSEFQTASVLAKKGYYVYLIPENNKTGAKNPDAIIDGDFAEFKELSGKPKKIWDLISKGFRQSRNVFVRTENDYSTKDIIQIIKGKFTKALQDDKKYLYPFQFDFFVFIDTENKEHKIDLKQIFIKIKNAE